jgi:hypothetical protein
VCQIATAVFVADVEVVMKAKKLATAKAASAVVMGS